jgi:hypothetical protein
VRVNLTTPLYTKVPVVYRRWDYFLSYHLK